jgi:hypothetical protein
MKFFAEPFAAFAMFAMFAPSVSEAQIMGPMYSVQVGGLPMNCTTNSGVPVGIYSDTSLNNIGIATTAPNGAPIIVLNPNVVAQYSPIVKQWWFAHECAHHALGIWNSETGADCFGAKQLVQFGILNNISQLQAFVYELANLPGSPQSGHLPGPMRAMAIANCALGFS